MRVFTEFEGEGRRCPRKTFRAQTGIKSFWTSLFGADLRGANLTLANLMDTNLTRANLQNAVFRMTKFDMDTTLPDGSKWTPDTEMARFTDPKHLNFYRLSYPKLSARSGKYTASQVDARILIGCLHRTRLLVNSDWEPPNLGELIERRKQLSQAIISLKSTAAKPLLEALERYVDMRPLIIAIIGWIGDDQAVGSLMHLMVDTSLESYEAAKALEFIGTPIALSSVSQWRLDMGVSDKKWVSRKLEDFYTIGDIDPVLMERIDNIAQRKRLEREKVIEAFIVHLNPHLEQPWYPGITGLTDDDYAFLMGKS